jgi:hypothetical protein
MEVINLIRLKNGDDIVCYVDQYCKDEMIVREPMLVVIKQDYKSGQHIIGMESWLPFQILKNNEVVIKLEDILFSTIVNDDFEEFYENTIDNLKVTQREKDNLEDEGRLTQEEMLIILKNIENNEGITH